MVMIGPKAQKSPAAAETETMLTDAEMREMKIRHKLQSAEVRRMLAEYMALKVGEQ